MEKKRLVRLIPFLLFTALLVGGPVGTAGQASASAPAPQAAQSENKLTGAVTGVSNKAKTIAIEVSGKTEMFRFDDNTTGMKEAKAGERVDVFFEMRDGERFATDVKLKLVSAPAGTSEIFSAEVAELIAKGPEKGNYLLVDTRPAPRYHEGHLPTAVSIPDTVIAEKGDEAFPEHVRANKNITLIFYCGGYT